MSTEIIMTEEGYEKLDRELTELKTIRRAEVAEKIKVARGFGDLSENSEYDEAKNEQAIIEARIVTIEEQLKHIKVVSKHEISTEVVSIGSVVKILDDGDEEEYHIVSSVESDNGDILCITETSPVGKALLGRRIGDEVEVVAPAGTFIIKVLDIHL